MPGRAKAADVLPMRRVVAMISYLRGEGKLRDAALVAVAAGFGLRIGDALSLTWEDILDEMGEVRSQLKLTEQKTGKTRIVRVFPFVHFVYEHTRDPVQTARITGHTNPAQLLRYIGRMAEGEKETWDRMEKALARSGTQ